VDIFKKKKEFEVLFEILEKYRNTEAHRRELLPYQKHLIIGISGKLRTSITAYFSEMETGESYYPRFEHIQDNLNNNWSRGKTKTLKTSNSLRVGDKLEFTLTANDPKNEELLYTVLPNATPYEFEWKTTNAFELEIKEQHIGNIFWIGFAVKSKRKYHSMKAVGLGKVDDWIQFSYEVFPPRE